MLSPEHRRTSGGEPSPGRRRRGGPAFGARVRRGAAHLGRTSKALRAAPAEYASMVNRDFERSVERRIRLWILEQEFDRKREGQRLALQQAASRDAQK